VMERPAAMPSTPPTSAGPAVGPTQSPSAPATHEGEVDKLGLLRQNWARVRELLQDRRRMLLGILTGGVRFLAIEQSEVIIGYDGNKKEAHYNARRLLEPENKATLESVLSDVLGGSYRITVLAEDQYQARPRPAPVTVQPPTPAPQPPGSSQPTEDPVVAYARELGAVVRELSTD